MGRDCVHIRRRLGKGRIFTKLLVSSLRFAVMQVKCRLQQLLLRGITGCSYLNVECITLFVCITLEPSKYKKSRYNVLGGYSVPSFFRTSATKNVNHLQIATESLLPSISKGTCFSGSSLKHWLRLSRHERKVDSAH